MKKYIMVVSGYFSKWLEAYVIPNQEAMMIAKMLIDNWISKFEVLMEIHSDQGRNFDSNLFQRITEILGIRRIRSTPLHPQLDGMVEWFNRTMEERLLKVMAENQKDWDRHLSLFLIAYRSAVHDTTGQTPARIVFGRELCLPCDILFGSPSEEPKKVIDYINDLKEKLLSVHETVRHKIKVASDRMKTRYHLKGNSVGFQAGDLIRLYNARRRKGFCPKLSPDWEGPYTVVTRIKDVVYRIRRRPKTKMKIVHLDRHVKYNSDTVDVFDHDVQKIVLFYHPLRYDNTSTAVRPSQFKPASRKLW